MCIRDRYKTMLPKLCTYISHVQIVFFITQFLTYYMYQPEALLENESIKIYWNREIVTDITIPANKQEIAILYKKKKEELSSVPLFHNIRCVFKKKSTNIKPCL